MLVTIATTTVTGWSHGGAAATLQIFTDQSFDVVGGSPTILGGTQTAFTSFACTVSGSVVTIPIINLYSTTDSSQPLARYTAVLYDSNNIRREAFRVNFALTDDSATTTWADIDVWNSAHRLRRQSYDFYTKTQIDALITYAPSSVVASTDSRIGYDLSLYGNSLSTAYTAISTATVLLEINAATTVSSSLDMSALIMGEPSGITLDPKHIITVDGAAMLTINKMRDPGNVRIFAGTGTVRFAPGAVDHLNLAWWVGADDGQPSAAEVTTAINTMIASAIYSGGGVLYFPQGYWTTNGGHVLSDSMTVRGVSSYPEQALGGTNIKMDAASTNDYIFKIGPGEYAVRFEDLLLDGNSVATTDGVLCEGTGGTSGDISFTNVTFNDCTRGFVHNSTAASWQLAQIGFYQCVFQSCGTGIRTNSVNGQITTIGTNFAVPASGLALDVAIGGLITITGAEFAGASAATSRVMAISGAHVNINFIGCQDEGFVTFIENDASDISGMINIDGCLVQSKIKIDETCFLNIRNSNLMSYALQGAPSGGYASVTDCYIRELSVNDGVTVVSPAILSSISTTTFTIVTEELPTLGKHVSRLPKRFISPISALGSASIPVVTICHIPDTTDEDKVLLRLGRFDTAEAALYYYDIYRDYGSGRLKFVGSQVGFRGYDFNSDIYAPIISVDDEAYAGGWNGSTNIPTKNAVYDKIEALDAAKQNLDAELTAIAGLTSAADKGIQFTGSGTASTFDLTAAGKALIDDASAALQRVTLGFNTKRLTANATETSVTMQELGNLSIALASGISYVGRLVLFVNEPTAADGIQIDFDPATTGATMTAFRAMGMVSDSVSTRVLAMTTAIATDIVDTTTTNDAIITIEIGLTCNVAGNFIPRFSKEAASAGTLTVYAGSYLTLDVAA